MIRRWFYIGERKAGKGISISQLFGITSGGHRASQWDDELGKMACGGHRDVIASPEPRLTRLMLGNQPEQKMVMVACYRKVTGSRVR